MTIKIYLIKICPLSVLHSYAGHGLYGGYLGYIPKRELIKYPDYVNKQNFLGKDHKNFKLINEYDTVINYIDETLEKVVFVVSMNLNKIISPLYLFIFLITESLLQRLEDTTPQD